MLTIVTMVTMSLVTMTFTPGENLISVNAAVKFVKLLFRYEQWDVFCSLSNNLVAVLSVSQLVKLFKKTV